jgi:hypothetical protein
MRWRKEGQSLVEMAFVMPMLVILLFGIIDLSYYIYGYATIYQAARNGAEEAAQTPPHPDWLDPAIDPNDICVANVLEAVQHGAVQFPDLTPRREKNEETGDIVIVPAQGEIDIYYPEKDDDDEPVRALGAPIAVSITYDIEPLTPLWNFIMMGNNGKMTVKTETWRTVESMGKNPAFSNLVACNPKPE